MTKYMTLFEQSIVDAVAGQFEPNEVFDDETIIDYVWQNFRPDDVFKSDELRQWALDNGFIEKE